MNWKKIYADLCARGAQRRSGTRKPATGYEDHHITPRCLGGSNAASNLARLSYREHLLAHLILCRIHPGVPGLALAARRLLSSRTQPQIKLTVKQAVALRTRVAADARIRAKKYMQDPSRRETSRRNAKAMHTPEAKAKQKESLARLRASESFEANRLAAIRAAAHKQGKRIKCIETGKVYASLSDAIAWLKSCGFNLANKSALSVASRTPGKVAYGFRWASEDNIAVQMASPKKDSSKPVVCIQLNITYINAKIAASHVCGDRKPLSNSICICCKGVRKSAYDLTWRYATPEEAAALKEKGASWAPLSELFA